MPKRWLALMLLALLGLLGWLQYRLWFGAGGEHEVDALAAQVQAQQARNIELKQRNDAMAAEVEDLKNPASGGAAVEERARDEFGLIKPGETFYRVVDDKAKPPAQTQPLPEPQGE